MLLGGRLGTTAGVVVVVVTLSIATQVVSATWLVHSFNTPNASTLIAKNLITTGEYWGGSQRMWDGQRFHILRAFQLPGEPLLLAAAFTALPEWAHRYLHVSIVALLTCVLTLVAKQWAGTSAAIVTGLIATFHPFVVLHGPVWDDPFLATALLWAVIAIGYYSYGRTPARPAVLCLVAFLSGAAALTRADCQAIILILGTTFVFLPGAKTIRPVAMAAIAGILLALAVWGVRNRVVLGSFAVGSTHDGITLWESNGPYSREALRMGQVEALSYSSVTMAPHWGSTAGMDEIQADGYYRSQAISYIVHHPVSVFRTGMLKAFLSIFGIRPNEPWHNLRNGVSILANVLVWLFALIGVLRPPRNGQRMPRSARLFVCLAIIGVVGALLILGPVGFRYCMPMEAVLWILAGHGVALLIPNRQHAPTGQMVAAPPLMAE